MLRVICDICGKDMTEETQRWIVNRINKETNHKNMMLLLEEMTKDEFDICPDCLELHSIKMLPLLSKLPEDAKNKDRVQVISYIYSELAKCD